MSDINETIETVEKQLTKLFRDNGVADIGNGDIYKAAPRYPAIDMLLTAREQGPNQVMQMGKIHWNLLYEINCMYAGSEGKQTFKNARKFVDKIYDIIQSEKDGALNGTIQDLECVSVEYGRTAIRNDIMADGGVITLLVQIYEVR